MGFLSAIKNIGSKVANSVATGASYLGGKVAKAGNAVANFADNHAGVIGAIGSAVGVPEAAMIAKTIGEGARTAANIGEGVNRAANDFLANQRGDKSRWQ
jgi:hypothetical protein